MLLNSETLEEHRRFVDVPSAGVAFSPDGEWLAAAGNGKVTCIKHRASGELRVLGNLVQAWALAWSSDGASIAACSKWGEVRIWDVATGTSRNLPWDRLEDQGIYCVAFSPDGKVVVAGAENGAILRWDVTTGAMLDTLHEHEEVVTSLGFSPDGRLLASGSFDCTVRLWDADTGDALETLRATGKPGRSVVPCIAFSPDGKLLASSHPFFTVILWDVETRQPMRTLKGFSVGSVCTTTAGLMAFSPSGESLAVASGSGPIYVYETSKGTTRTIDFKYGK